MSYHGDINLGDTIDIKFATTAAATGAPTILTGTPVISAYVDNGTTQITAGITLTADFDTVTGLNNVRVVASSGNGFAAGTNVQLVITTGTVGGTSAVGYVVGSFSIEKRSALRPTTAGRTLDVASTGEAGVDFDNILFSGNGPFPPLGIIDRGTAQAADANGITLRAAFSTAAANMVGKSVWVYSSTNGLHVTGLATAYNDTTKVLTVSGLGEAPTGTVLYVVFATANGSTAAIADAVWDEATTSHTTAGTFGEQVKTDIDAIKVKTDQLTFTVANQVDATTKTMNATTVLGAGTAGDKWRGS